MSTDAHLAWTPWLGYAFLCLDIWLTEGLTNEADALEDVLREEEGKDFFGCLLGYCTVCNIMADAWNCQPCQILDSCSIDAAEVNFEMHFYNILDGFFSVSFFLAEIESAFVIFLGFWIQCCLRKND